MENEMIKNFWRQNICHICNAIIFAATFYIFLTFPQDGIYFFLQKYGSVNIAGGGVIAITLVVLFGLWLQRYKWYLWTISIIAGSFVGAALWSIMERIIVSH